MFHVQHIDGEYRVELPAEALEALYLTEGSAVELRPVAQMKPNIGTLRRKRLSSNIAENLAYYIPEANIGQLAATLG